MQRGCPRGSFPRLGAGCTLDSMTKKLPLPIAEAISRLQTAALINGGSKGRKMMDASKHTMQQAREALELAIIVELNRREAGQVP